MAIANLHPIKFDTYQEAEQYLETCQKATDGIIRKDDGKYYILIKKKIKRDKK